jgi:hypothetical protein
VREAQRRHVRLGYSIEGDCVTLFEERPGLLDPDRRVRLDMVRIRFDRRTKTWSLDYAGADSKWHSYYLKPRADFERLLREIDEDPVRVFGWGRQ